MALLTIRVIQNHLSEPQRSFIITLWADSAYIVRGYKLLSLDNIYVFEENEKSQKLGTFYLFLTNKKHRNVGQNIFLKYKPRKCGTFVRIEFSKSTKSGTFWFWHFENVRNLGHFKKGQKERLEKWDKNISWQIMRKLCFVSRLFFNKRIPYLVLVITVLTP